MTTISASPQRYGWVTVLIFFLLVGCNKDTRPTLMASMAKDEITVSQLRANNYEYAARFGHAAAARARDIIENTEDPVVINHALRWRMWAQPQARVASFAQDPLVALIELWILADQQHQFFTVGVGSKWFGAQQERVQRTTLALKEQAAQMMADTMSPDALRIIRETKRDWVKENPIERELVFRPRARADLANLLPPRQSSGTLRAVPSMQESLGDMNDRLTILTDQGPVEARWQAEYLVASLLDDGVYEDVDTVVGSLESITGFLDTFEETAARQTDAIFDRIERQRVMIFSAIEQERADILSAVADEREAILGAVDSQLSSTTSSIDEVARGLIDDAKVEIDGVGRGLIDHFFVRLSQFLVVVGLGMLLYRRMARRRTDPGVDQDRNE